MPSQSSYPFCMNSQLFALRVAPDETGEEVGRNPEGADVPTFIWRKLSKNKVKFSHTSNTPIAELEIPY